MGSDGFSVPILERLLADGPRLDPAVQVVGVVTQPDRPHGRGRRLDAGPVAALGRRCGVSVLQPARLRAPEAVDALAALEPDLVVVASYGQILPGSVLAMPRCGCLNLHPSLLPKYRGPSPIVAPILDGAAETGTTLMVMSARMDAGPVVDQVVIQMSSDVTAGELEHRLARLSADLMIRDLPDWLSGSLEPREQDDQNATYTALVHKDDGLLQWDLSAPELARRVMAYNPRPTAFTWWHDRQVRLLRASADDGHGDPGRVLEENAGSVIIGTGRGVLRVSELQIAGGKPLTASAFLRGQRGFVGTRLGGAPL